jgi:hypothetical protein
VQDLTAIPPIQWSFTAISPKYIKQLSKPKDRHITSVLQFAIPWAYIFSVGNNKDSKLAEIITNNLENVYWSLDNEYRRRRKEKPRFRYERLVSENPQPSKMIVKSIPLSVLYLMTRESFPGKAPFANVSVLSRIPIQQALDVELKKVESSTQWKKFPSVFAREIARIQSGETNYLLPYIR